MTRQNIDIIPLISNHIIHLLVVGWNLWINVFLFEPLIGLESYKIYYVKNKLCKLDYVKWATKASTYSAHFQLKDSQ